MTYYRQEPRTVVRKDAEAEEENKNVLTTSKRT